MALVEPVFFDTSVLLGGLVEFETADDDAQRVFDAIAQKRLRRPQTAWHCCLELYAVSTRIPPEFRLTPEDALRLIESEILERFEVHQLPEGAASAFLHAAVQNRVAGGRIYDAHIAEIARLARAGIVVTENRRHFTALLSHGIRVLTSSELVRELTR